LSASTCCLQRGQYHASSADSRSGCDSKNGSRARLLRSHSATTCFIHCSNAGWHAPARTPAGTPPHRPAGKRAAARWLAPSAGWQRHAARARRSAPPSATAAQQGRPPRQPGAAGWRRQPCCLRNQLRSQCCAPLHPSRTRCCSQLQLGHRAPPAGLAPTRSTDAWRARKGCVWEGSPPGCAAQGTAPRGPSPRLSTCVVKRFRDEVRSTHHAMVACTRFTNWRATQCHSPPNQNKTEQWVHARPSGPFTIPYHAGKAPQSSS
jgi:hypothetical protein